MLFEEEYEKLGESEVRKLLLLPENSNSLFLKAAPAWLAFKDAERIARAEARADSAIEISLSQVIAAERASRYAMYAAMVATIAALVASKDEIFSLIFSL